MDNEEYFKGILDNLTGGLVSMDEEGIIVYVNPMAGKILHITDTAKLIGYHFERVLAAYPALCNVMAETVKTHKTMRRSEISILHGNTPLIIGYSTLQIKNHEGNFMGIAVIFQDITFVSQKKTEAKS